MCRTTHTKIPYAFISKPTYFPLSPKNQLPTILPLFLLYYEQIYAILPLTKDYNYDNRIKTDKWRNIFI